MPISEYCMSGKASAKAQIECQRMFGFDAVFPACSDLFRETEACGVKLLQPYDDLPWPVKPAIEDKRNLYKLKVPDPYNAGRMTEKGIVAVKECAKELKGEVPIVGWVESPLQQAVVLRGIAGPYGPPLAYDVKEDPEFVKELLEFTFEVELKYGIAQLETGADILGVSNTAGGFLSPQKYMELALPYDRKIIDEFKRHGAKILYHICGDTSHILDLIPETGTDIVQLDLVDLAIAVKVDG